MAAQVYEFKVEMSCGGCATAVKKVLEKLKDQGVQKVEVSLEDQTVTVTSTLPAETILETIKKSGKTTTYIGVKK